MVTKKKTTKKKMTKHSAIRTKSKGAKKIIHKKKIHHKKEISEKKIPTLQLRTDHEVAFDFATKVYKEFSKIIKSIILFGSVSKQKIDSKSDLDIIILIDDVSITWNQELIAWYREELDKIISKNPYKSSLHINTIKLSTWWDDLLKGDPVVLNIIRNGMPLIDNAGFIEPLKHLMVRGKIKGTPEAIYQCLQRAPTHLARSKAAELTAIDGIYWSMVDSAHGALIAAEYFPPSPEHVMVDLKDAFVDRKLLKYQYVEWYKEIYHLHKKVDHREISDLKKVNIDMWQQRADEFLKVMVNLVERIINKK
jgi:predicted nucleotidyltransferase/uncharacterized protein (UPF0332 family)